MYQTLKKIRDLLRETFGDSIRGFFIDDPNFVPFSELPCIAIAPISTDINILDTAKDSYTYTIDVILIIDAKQELQKFKKEMVGTQYLAEVMESMDDEGALKPNTVLYVLRNNLRLDDNWYINNIASIDYSLRTRAVGTEQFVTKEATLRFSVVRIKNRP